MTGEEEISEDFVDDMKAAYADGYIFVASAQRAWLWSVESNR